MQQDSPRFTLRKGEKLRHRSLVESLFREGKALYDFPLRLVWKTSSHETLNKHFRNNPPDGIDKLQMLVTIPKKKRKKAVDRVLMRRRIREAYRLNRLDLKETVYSNPDIRTLSIAFIYQHNENIPYDQIEKKMKNLLSKLKKQCQKSLSQ